MANLVVSRCRTLHDAEDRQLVLWIQELSCQQGQIVHRNLSQLPAWPLPFPNARKNETGLELLAIEFIERSQHHPTRELIRETVEWLGKLCLDPGNEAFDHPKRFLSSSLRWKSSPIQILRDIQQDANAVPCNQAATTSVAEAIWDAMDYALFCSGLVLVLGEYRIGKSFAAQTWVAGRLGASRYVQLSSATSEEAFYRQLCAGLGVSAALTRKCGQLRDRVEATLRERQLALVIDEAQYVWPQSLRSGHLPSRLLFCMSMANVGVPVVLVGSRDFSRMAEAFRRKFPLWSQADLWGRVRLHVELPDALTESDLKAILDKMNPGLSESATMLLIGYALTANGHVSALESVLTRARYLERSEGKALSFKSIETSIRDIDPAWTSRVAGSSIRRTCAAVPQKPRKTTAAAAA